MNTWGKISIIAGVVGLFVLLLWYFGREPVKDDTYVSDSWIETFDPADKSPYGTYMLKELMDTVGLFGNFLELDQPLEEALQDNPDLNDIYFFIGRTNYMDDSAAMYLFDFISEGNTAFLATTEFPDEFLYRLKFEYEDLFENIVWDSIQYFRFLHPDISGQRYESKYVYNDEVAEKSWSYFNPNCFELYDEDTIYALGTNTKELWNFVRIDYGEGQIFLHSTPFLYTNISMMKRTGFQYAEYTLRHIPPGRVQWDRYNLEYHYNWEDYGEGGGGEERKSIFQFLLEHPPLIWASIIFLIGAFLYAIFKGKRMQRIVPAAESRENTSMRYVNTVASLYMQEKKHNKLVHLKKKTFLNFIAERYFIISNNPDDKFFEKVALKSHIPKTEIEKLFINFDQLERSHVVSDDQLIELTKKIENFYNKCR